MWGSALHLDPVISEAAFEHVNRSGVSLRLVGLSATGRRVAAIADLCLWIVIEVNYIVGLLLPFVVYVMYITWYVVLRVRARRSVEALQLKPQDSARPHSVGSSDGPRLLLRGDSATISLVRDSEPIFGDPQWFRVRDNIPGWWLFLWPLVPSAANSYVLERELLVGTFLQGSGRMIVVSAILLLLMGRLVRELPIFSLHQAGYRVYPGRLERLEWNAYSTKTTVTSSMDLRRSKLVCDVSMPKLVIKPPLTSGQNQVPIDLREVDKPLDFVRAVFQASILEHGTEYVVENCVAG